MGHVVKEGVITVIYQRVCRATRQLNSSSIIKLGNWVILTNILLLQERAPHHHATREHPPHLQVCGHCNSESETASGALACNKHRSCCCKGLLPLLYPRQESSACTDRTCETSSGQCMAELHELNKAAGDICTLQQRGNAEEPKAPAVFPAAGSLLSTCGAKAKPAHTLMSEVTFKGGISVWVSSSITHLCCVRTLTADGWLAQYVR